MLGHKRSLLLTQGNQTGIFYYKHRQLSLSTPAARIDVQMDTCKRKEHRP